jgi:hypothetical protein
MNADDTDSSIRVWDWLQGLSDWASSFIAPAIASVGLMVLLICALSKAPLTKRVDDGLRTQDQRSFAVRDWEEKWFARKELQFWLWASLGDAKRYIEAAHASETAMMEMGRANWEDQTFSLADINHLSDEVRHAAYHFVTTLGFLMRVLKSAQHIFPIIQPAYSQANHCLKEAKFLRDMVEHQAAYYEGSGKHGSKFTRADTAVEGVAADATSTVVDKDGHAGHRAQCG